MNLGLRSSGPVTFTVSFGPLREGCLPSAGLSGSSLGGWVSAAPLCGGTRRRPALAQSAATSLRFRGQFCLSSWKAALLEETDPSSFAFQLEWLARHVSLDLSPLEWVCQGLMRTLGCKELSFENCLAQHSRIPFMISLAPRFLLPFG